MTNEKDDKVVYILMIDIGRCPEIYGLYSTSEKAHEVIANMEPMEDDPWVERWGIDLDGELYLK